MTMTDTDELAAAGTTTATAAEADAPEDVRFSPEEEKALLQESHDIKSEANSLFASQDYHNAISRYDDALASCPNYLDYERAVLQSNIAACHLKLEQWGDAVKAATSAVDGLARIEAASVKPGPSGESVETPRVDRDATKGASRPSGDPEASDGSKLMHKHKDKDAAGDSNDNDNDGESEIDEEIVSTGAAKSAQPRPPSPLLSPAAAPPPQPPFQSPTASQTRTADILRIRTKALLRRGRARSEQGGWQTLAGAEEDYRTLSEMPGLGPADLRTVRHQLRALPPRTKAAQEAEMGEMWGKLRQLGDGILKPFGLSTQNFQMVKDENSGGYSMNFNQGGGS